jgi:S1-C subfamily serine protease
MEWGMGRSRPWQKEWTVCTALTGAFALFCAIFINAQSEAQQRTGTVYRGVLTGGIWVELGVDGAGRAEFAVLDGLPGGAPETRFVSLFEDRSSGGCILRAQDGSAAVSPCPSGGSLNAQVTIGAFTGEAVLQTVGWQGSIAWGDATSSTTDVRTQCGLSGLAQSQGATSAAFSGALATVAREAQSLPATNADTRQALSRLRAERLRTYAIIQLTPIEAQRARMVEDAVAGRPVLGRTVPLAQATRDRIAFDAEVVNSPQRAQARQDLLQIDRALSEIYDPTASNRRFGVMARLRDQSLPAAFRGLQDMLAAGQPGAIKDLISLEASIAQVDVCAQAAGANAASNAQATVRAAMTNRAGEISDAIRAAVAATSDSASARAALAEFENNAAVRAALEQAGRMSVFAEARARISAYAQAEERVRLDGEREAARQAALDRIPPTTRAAGFSAERVARSVVRIYMVRGDRIVSSGSGVIVAPGYIVTNHHVISDYQSQEVVVITNGSPTTSMVLGSVVRDYPEYDIALVSVPGLEGRVVELAAENPRQGQPIYAFGFPGAVDSSDRLDPVQSATLTDGIVSRTENMPFRNRRLSLDQIQHTAVVSPGNSGGPLFDACHRVIGINTWVLMNDDRTNAVYYFAVSSTVLQSLLQSAGVRAVFSEPRC